MRSMTSNLRYFLEASAHVHCPVWKSQYPRATLHAPHSPHTRSPPRPVLGPASPIDGTVVVVCNYDVASRREQSAIPP